MIKVKTLFLTTTFLGLLSVLGVSAYAKTPRYPTAAEIKKQMPSISEGIKYWQNETKSAPVDIKQRNFARAWSKINPSVAPFLGTWWVSESSVSIYPTNVKGRVCLISFSSGIEDTPSTPNGTAIDFSTGTVVNNQIRQSDNRYGSVLFRHGKYLVDVIYLNSESKIYSQVYNPSSLESVQSWGEYLTPKLKNQLFRKYKAAGCTTAKNVKIKK